MTQESEHAKCLAEHEEILSIQRETGMNFHEAKIEMARRKLSMQASRASEFLPPPQEIKIVPDFGVEI